MSNPLYAELLSQVQTNPVDDLRKQFGVKAALPDISPDTAPRIGAGLINTVKNIPGLYAAPDALRDLYNVFVNKQTPDPTQEWLPGAHNLMDWMTETDADVREFVGLDRADPIAEGNVQDALLENVPGVLLPFGALAKVAQLGKAPKIVQSIANVATTLAGAPTTKVGKLLAGTAIGGVTGGLAYLNQPDLHNELKMQAMTELEPEQLTKRTVYRELVSRAMADAEIAKEDGFSWKDAGIVGGSVAAAIMLAKTIKSNAVRKIMESSEKFGLNAPEPSRVGSVGKLEKGFIDRDKPLTEFLAKSGDEVAADFVDMSRPGGSIEARMRSVMGTGKIAGWNGQLPKLADINSKVAILSPEQRNMLVEGIRAGDKLTMYRRDPSKYGLGGETYADLRAKLRAVQDDPGVVGELARGYRDLARGMSQFRYDKGLIDDATRALWQNTNTWYMPWYARDDRGLLRRGLDGIVDRGGGYLRAATDQHLKQRTGQVPDDVKLVEPFRAMEQYVFETIKAVDDNEARRYIVKNMLNSPDPAIKNMIRKAKQGDAETFEVRENGKRTSYFIKDPVLRQSLQFTPQASGALLNAARFMNNAYTYGTTGPLNPLQSIRAFTYDALGAVATAPRTARYTPTVAGFDLGLIPGVGQAIALGQGSIGALALLKANLARSFANNFRDIANKGGVLSGMSEVLSQKLAAQFENSVLDMMERYGAISARYLHADNVVTDFKTVMRELSPEFAAKSPVAARTYNVYHSILDSLQNGARAFYFMKHARKAQGDDAYSQMLKVAKNTRQLTGDFGKSGDANFNTGMRAGVPYWNPALQSFATLYRAAKKDPLHFSLWTASTMATAAGAAAYMINASPEHAHWYRNQLSMSDRNRYIWLPKVIDVDEDGNIIYGAPEQSFAIPLPPEFQTLNALGVGYTEAMHDAVAEGSADPDAALAWEALSEMLGNDKFQAQIGEAASQANPLGVPTIVAQMGALAGMKFPLGRFAPESVFQSPYDDGIISPTTQQMFSSFLGTAGATFSRAIDQGSIREGGISDKFSAGLDQIIEDAGHYAPTVAPLWNHSRSLTGGTYDAKVFKDQNAAIERIQSTIPFIKDALSGAMGVGDFQTNRTTQKMPLTTMDPALIDAFLYVDKVSRQLDPLKSRINALREEISSIQNDGRMSPSDKTKLMSDRQRQISMAQRYMVRAYTTLLEEPLAKMLGKPTSLADLAEASNMSVQR